MRVLYVSSLLILQLFFLLSSNAQTANTDSLIRLLAPAKNDTIRINLLNKIARQYWSSDPEKVRIYAEQALHLAHKNNYQHGVIRSYFNLGSYYRVRNQCKKALPYYEKALDLALEKNSRADIAVINIYMGICYEYLGNYTLALQYSMNGLKISEQIGARISQARAFSAIGDLMRRQKKYTESLTYYHQALKLFTGLEKAGEAYSLSNIGVVYTDLKQPHKAINYVNKSLRILNSIQHFAGQAMCYNTLGGNYTELGQYEKALVYFRQALDKSLPKGYTTTAALAMQGMAKIYLRTQKPGEAIRFYQQSLQLALKQGLAEEKMVAFAGLTDAFTQQNNLSQALYYQGKLLAFKDSLFNEESTQRIAQLQADYQVEKKQAEIELLKKDQERAALLRNAALVGLLAILLIGALIVSRQRLKIAQAKEVAQKNAQLAQQANALAEQAQKLQELDKVKSNFFANISHEFRTPLTLILGSLTDKLTRLNQPNSAESIMVEGKEIKVMHRQASRLLELINQLLDLSKLESGKLSLQPKPGDAGQFFRMLTSSFSSLAQYRNINFTLSLPDTDLVFEFDADKWEKIFGNLLSNAFKFTPDSGQVSFHVALLPTTVGFTHSMLQVTLQDNGLGIPPQQIDKVFDRFYQGSPHYYSDQQGTGIGLALVKELVQLHQGKVWAEADTQPGARLVVQLPVKAINALADKPKLLPLPAITLSPLPENSSSPELPNSTSVGESSNTQTQVIKENKPLILIVEDNADLRQYIRQHLQGTYRVLESENGLQGMEKAIERVPDLIISDLMMPEMNGLELCEKIKNDERTSHIPFILLTALATNESKLEGLETGADDYLIKPFHAPELQARVHNLIQSRKKLRARFGKEIRVQPKDITVSSMDEKFLEKALQTVEANLSNPDFGAEEFSREIGMSRMQLHRKLTALTGQSTSDFLRTLRLKRAAQLLASRAGNVSEIAYQVGFNSLPYFSKCFREQFGVPANTYSAQQEPIPGV